MFTSLDISGAARTIEVLRALDAANGKRKARTLTPEQIIDLIARVAAMPADGVFYEAIDGGAVANNYGFGAYCTVALAARIDGTLYLGLGVSKCPSPSPGRTWPELQPYGRGEKFAAKLRAWTKSPGVIKIKG